jgi:hypothetical protein
MTFQEPVVSGTPSAEMPTNRPLLCPRMSLAKWADSIGSIN